ncbi:SAM-dependent methyltransferase [Actinocrinis puniceicyclus]|uniref:SAM-dependent methyltransferase n=1 Tax=Actinocrinis puniceicyclus TaxID=977794 RepID=A0A8J8BDI4_9ACTN|nr:SAM-dependent methyltransferase [Actinocrinis puniceicyclus]MBS2965288.1 SAM-dependent methyltransferase [Actinocrinis puniceicyclus]
MAEGPSPWDQDLVPDWEPPQIDTSVPHPNRMYNYLIGGKDHFKADRDAAEALIKARPDTIITARAAESFTRRAVRKLAQDGIRQFLQMGAAITIANSNDQAAGRSAPDIRTFIYVADDPISLAHARALLVGRPGPPVIVVGGNFREPQDVLARPGLAGKLDFDEPIGLLLFGMLDFIASERRARRALDYLMGRVAPGSMAAFYHVIEVESEEVNNALDRTLAQDQIELTPRTAEHVRELVSGYEFVHPGLVPITDWHPDGTGPGTDMAERTAAIGGVIIKR